MTDDCVVDPVTVEAQSKALADIASAVSAVGSAASLRVGDGDYGAAFGWFASIVNKQLASTEEVIKRHGGEIETHLDEFRKNISATRRTDQSGATALTETSER
ncbi:MULTISPECIES: hypothetical protein [Tsukamurella]|uniref:Excreted virulence factor EspC, type VII ESX diderm n=1 Tax=Tsukamurella paurometabola TaxID=2061 RepID=A0A3P8LGC1_TSUPA|nr:MULTISPECIES: hypothetical protein [Tsukamurella]QRY83724.1 hypothetical protein JVY00_18010 [Tsukamurella tyrosinosolvens]UEA83232.1 hypothetical protein LK411_23280 [Tsukamurella paurometabola]VDR40332.1 Uncharacterised protein [Tsukamurella paurometabola]